MTSGTAKGGNNYYERDGERHYLPGYINANALSLLTVGKEISELDTETKVVSVYNKELKAEAPTKVEVPMDLIGQEILVGLIKETAYKNVKNDDGMYVPTDETRNQNVIDKLFRASDKKTTAEIRAQAEEASFYETWCDKWNGKTRDRTSKQASGGTSASKPAATKKPTTSLFG